MYILNANNISQYYSFFDQINAALVTTNLITV